MPNITPDGTNYPGGDTRRKAPRGMAFKSEAKWTPNSFGFGDVQIKQEPLDDYGADSLDSSNRNMMPYKEVPTGSNGNKSFGSSEHPKAPPRKRSPGSTCFDRFEKKSTPTSKKVSPLSVYAKVQDSIVLNVKCRRFKKRTKAANSKEEVIYPSKDDIENWKRNGAYSESPDQAVRHLMGDLLEKVSQFGARIVHTGPDLSQIDSMKFRELVFQFCQRYSLDYRDFEDIESVMRLNVINDKSAKNSIRASAIRKRISVSPEIQKLAPEQETKPPKTEKVVKRSTTNDAPKSRPAERRVLRSLPGRVERGRQSKRRGDKTCSDKTSNDKARSDKNLVVRKRYSTRSSKEVEEVSNSDVDIIIDSSTDRESEAGKEAEVRKKSQRLKNKQPVETPAKENSKPPTRPSRTIPKKEEPRTRSKEKKETEKIKDIAKAAPKKKWSRLHISSENSSSSSSSSGDSVEIINSNSSSPEILGKETKICIKIEPLPLKSLTAFKSERTCKSSKPSEDSVIKTSDEPSKYSKQTEESTNKTKEIETSFKNSKQKDLSSNKIIPKKEEIPNNKISQRKLSQKSVPHTPNNKKDHFMGRRSRTIPIKIEEDSSDSKDGVESSSKTSDKKLQNVSLKNNDLSSDESKDSVVESKTGHNENKTNPIVNTKTSKQKESESSSSSTNSSSNDTSDSKRNENPSSKPEGTERSSLSKYRLQKFENKPVKLNFLSDRNEPTLQIKLNRLPLKLDSKKRFLPLESQDFYCSIIKGKDNSSESSKNNEDNDEKDLQDPPQLVCMKEPPKDKSDSEDKPLDDVP